MLKWSDLPALHDLSRQLYETILATVEPYINIVRNMANINTPPLTQSSSTTPQKLPFPQARRMACTHLTMQRLYGDLQCPICRRDPDLGYTYLCSQDETDVSSSDAKEMRMELFENVEMHSGTQEESGPDQISRVSAPHTKLSPWIEEAIVKGEYTPEQVTILRAQKQKVNDTIATALENFRLSQISASDKPSTVSAFIEDTSYLPFPVMAGANDRVGSVVAKRPEARLFPYCAVRACQTCRPTFRDRAWQKLEEVFGTTEAPIINFENDNRRLSNPSIVATLGLQKSAQNPPRPHLQTFGSFSFYQNPRRAKRALSDTTVRQRPSTTGSRDIADQMVEGESVGFRDSVKRALRGILFNRRDSTSSRQSSRSSRLISRKMRVREEDSTDDRVDFDTALWRRFNDELLREASTTKLPGHDGMDGLESQSQEVEVENGVAVTEEAVDTGTPDVIMSV